jgi:hypothetical protein
MIKLIKLIITALTGHRLTYVDIFIWEVGIQWIQHGGASPGVYNQVSCKDRNDNDPWSRTTTSPQQWVESAPLVAPAWSPCFIKLSPALIRTYHCGTPAKSCFFLHCKSDTFSAWLHNASNPKEYEPWPPWRSIFVSSLRTNITIL